MVSVLISIMEDRELDSLSDKTKTYKISISRFSIK